MAPEAMPIANRQSIQTRSALKILMPISNKISKLLLIHEAYRITKGDSQVPIDLGAQADMLTPAITDLILVAQKLSHCSNEEAKEKMGVACGLLENVVRNVSLASHKLAMEPLQLKYHSLYANSCRELVKSLYRVMAAIEEVDVNKIEKAASWVKDRLSVIISCKNPDSLVPIFKQYTEALLLLLNLVAKQQRDLCNEHQQRALGISAIVLKKVAPMINKSLQMTLKYPMNSQAKSALQQVEGDILHAVQDIVDNVKDINWPENSADGGAFVSLIDQLLELLKIDDDRHIVLLKNDFESLVDKIVTHSIAVSRLAELNSEERKLVVVNCQQVIECTYKLASMAANLRTNPMMQQLRQDIDDLVDDMISELHDLERHVNSVLVYQVIDCFKQTSEPLNRFVQSIASQASATPDGDPAYDEFSNHADLVYQVAGYVADSSSDAISVAKLKESVAMLKKLDAEILPALASYHQNPTNPTNVECLRQIKSRWSSEIDKLRDIIDSVSDSVVYVEVSECQIKNHLGKSKMLLELRCYDVAEFACHIQSITDLCKHLLIVLNQQSSDDFHIQDKLQGACSKLKSVMNGVRSVSNRIAAEPGNTSLHELFNMRTGLLLRCFSHLRSLLNNDSDLESFEQEPEGTIENLTPRNEDKSNIPTGEPSPVKLVSEGATQWLSLETPDFSISGFDSGDYSDGAGEMLHLIVSKIRSPDKG